MGKKSGWFSAVKKALSHDSKDKKDQLKNTKSRKLFAKERDHDCPPSSEGEPPKPIEDGKSVEVIESDLQKHANAETTPDTVSLRDMFRYSGKSEEEIAAIRIQTVFRGLLARRALRALSGIERLKDLIEGQSVKRQSSTTLKCMQDLAHLQSQIRARRIRMTEENQALHRQLQMRHDKELQRLRMGNEWNVSTRSKEQIKAKIQNKQDAATRRERALAYSFSHQTKKNSRCVKPSFMDPNNPHWGWSWVERWMASRPWDLNDRASSKGTISRSISATKPSPTSSHPPKVCESKSKTSIQSQYYRRHSTGGTLVIDKESVGSSSPPPSYMTTTKSTKAKTKPASPLGITDNSGSTKKPLSFLAAHPSGPRRHSTPGKIVANSVKNGVNSQAE